MMNNILILLKGMAMGAADVVPGVSGGTIAFITGIYDRLLGAISSVNIKLIKTLKNEGLVAAWKKIDGTFLSFLFGGIMVSVFSLAKILNYLLKEHPILLWAFFFGLIVASIIYVGKQVQKWNWQALLGLVIGTILVFWISTLRPMSGTESLLYIFICGVIAICAMILPGISGSFLLLILGAYQIILNAVDEFNLKIIAVFGAGAIVGLLSFSNALKWVLKHYRNTTIAVLTGFLVGSLYKIWPWKRVEEIFVKHAGEAKESVVHMVEPSVLPNSAYQEYIREGAEIVGYTAAEPLLGKAILCSILGFMLLFGVEKLAIVLKKGK